MLDQITVETCIVEQAILHLVDRSKGSPELADVALELDSDLRGFIRGHIAESLPRCHVGVFKQRDENPISLCCETIMADRGQLVPQSQALAHRLYDHMRRKNIKSGTLWVVVFGRADDAARYLALMKMDETPAFTYQALRGPSGRQIQVRVNHHGLPDARTKIDKVAFILPRDTRPMPYELRFLDTVRTDRGVAKFFQDFLDCQAPQSDRDKTKIFDRQVEVWIQGNRERLPEAIREQHLRELKHTYLRTNDEIDIRQFASAALGDQNCELQDSLIRHLQDHQLHDPTFTVDLPPRSSRRVTWRFATGEQRVEVSGDPGALAALVHVEDPVAGRNHYLATIKADRFEEMSRPGEKCPKRRSKSAHIAASARASKCWLNLSMTVSTLAARHARAVSSPAFAAQ